MAIIVITAFDPADYLDSDGAAATYMSEALATGDAAFVADALSVVARARREQRCPARRFVAGEPIPDAGVTVAGS